MAVKKSVCAFTDNSLRHYMFGGRCAGNGEPATLGARARSLSSRIVRLSIRMRQAASSANQERLSVRIGLDRFEWSGAYSYSNYGGFRL
jgi:hypothetical protein